MPVMIEKKAVLIVDDEPFIRNLIKHIVEIKGHIAHLASGHEEAQRFMRMTRYDLVLLDLHMPGKTGLEMIEEMKDQVGRVVVVTGVSDPDVEKRCLVKGASEVIHKPFRSAELQSAMDRFLKD